MNNRAAGIEHPDENLLAAFAERSLTATERDRVLLHLSACSRCREIAFLAQQAEPENLHQQPDAAIPVKETWLPFQWNTAQRIGWAAVPALAAVLLAGISVHWYRASHRQPATAVTQTAIARNQPAPLSAPPVPESRSSVPTEDTARAKVIPGHDRREIHSHHNGNSHTDSTGSSTDAIAVGGTTATVLPRALGGTAAAPPVNQTAEPASAAALKPVPQIAEPQPIVTATSQTVTVTPPAPVITSTEQAQVQTLPMKAQPASPAISHQAAVNGRLSGPASFSGRTAFHTSAARAATASASPVILLPNGMRAISLVRLTARHVALDQDGNLFLRANADDTWKPIAKQWTGKAAALSTVPAPQIIGGFMSAEKKQSGNESQPAPPQPDSAHAATLRLINDTGGIWTSTDSGETWHPQAAAPPQK